MGGCSRFAIWSGARIELGEGGTSVPAALPIALRLSAGAEGRARRIHSTWSAYTRVTRPNPVAQQRENNLSDGSPPHDTAFAHLQLDF